MAAGVDELLEFLLKGIAICGPEGASSTDFYRIVNNYYKKQKKPSSSNGNSTITGSSVQLDRGLYEKVWRWVTDHPDARIYYRREARTLTLAEFEALENQDTQCNDTSQATASGRPDQSLVSKYTPADNIPQPSQPLTSLGLSMRQRLLAEGNQVKDALVPQATPSLSMNGDEAAPASSPKVRETRKIPANVQVSVPAFDVPNVSIKAPRLFTSQNRTWIAVAGHPIDLKRVAGLEFVLLSIIARAGPDGISQPTLQKIANQDKRSVPARTVRLQENGYIDKRPIQDGAARTSLCTHKMYMKDKPKEPESVNDVFGLRTLHLTGVLFLLNKVLATENVVQVRQLRVKMGVSVERWNGRAVRGALIRLEQTGYLERFMVEKKRRDPRLKNNPITCIRRLREPEEDDIKNLKFRRIETLPDAAHSIEEEPLEEDNAGDGFMRDLELDMMGEVSDDADDIDTTNRIPPQWTPDRLLTNMVVDAIEKAGTDGIDTAKLRDMTTGFFWKRPLESLATRLSEHWYFNQPLHTRHLTIVRDTAMTSDVKRVHYSHRTHRNFQKAVDAGEVTWEALQLEKGKKPSQKPPPPTSVDSLGFQALKIGDFHKGTGASPLSETCAVGKNKPPLIRDWEVALLNGDSGQPRSSTPGGVTRRVANSSVPRPLLTQAERLALGLKAKGRLGADYESQIRAHRQKTGDPDSIPEKLIKWLTIPEPGTKSKKKAQKPRKPSRLSSEVAAHNVEGIVPRGSLTHDSDVLDIADDEPRPSSRTSERQEAQHEPGTSTEGLVHQNLTDSEDVAMLDRNESPASHFANPEREADDASIHAKPSNRAGSDQAPRKERVYRKRTSDAAEVQAGRPRKKSKKSTMEIAEGAQFVEPDSIIQLDGSSDVQVLGTNVTSALGPKPSSEERLLSKRAVEIDPSHASSPLPASMDVDANRVEPSTPLHLAKTTNDGSVSHTNTAKPKTQLMSSEAALRAQAYKAQYDKRCDTGMYFDPTATRPGKGGRGRPKKMFLATFRLPGLHTLDWFVPDPNQKRQNLPATSLSTASAKALAEERSFVVKKQLTPPRPSPTINQVSPGISTTFTKAPSIVPARQVSSPPVDIVEPMEVDGLSEVATVSPRTADRLIGSSQKSLGRVEGNVPNVQTTLEQDASSVSDRPLPATSPLPHIMTPAPLSHDTPCQSPYASLTSHNAPRSEIPQAKNETATMFNETPPRDESREASSVPGEQVAEAQLYAHATPKKQHETLRIGGGSANYMRKKLVLHILDLCGGILPTMDALYNVFPGVWDHLGLRKTGCPSDNAIRDDIYAMVRNNELSIAKFKINREDLPGVKRRKIYFRSSLQFSSPEVQKIVAEMTGAYPEKYCPPRLEQYWKEREKEKTKMPKVDNSWQHEVYPPTSRKLDERVKQAKDERKRLEKLAKQQKIELDKEAKAKAKVLEQRRKVHAAKELSGSRQKTFRKRQRLAGLNEGQQVGVGHFAARATMDVDDSSEDEPLINRRRRHRMAAAHIDDRSRPALAHTEALMAPSMTLHSSTHTFSTEMIVPALGTQINANRKRVRIEELTDRTSHKKMRTSYANDLILSGDTEDDFFARHHIRIRDTSAESFDDEDEDDGATRPTIAQRLSGLTGDLNEPDFEPRKRKKQPTWSETARRRNRLRRTYGEVQEAKGRTYPESFDPLGKFRKLCYTLVLASSMAGGDGAMDWNIVSTVYSDTPHFDLEKTKKKWAWMQKRMPEHLRRMTESFESDFLIAYEAGKIDAIGNPDTYDWAKLVRWALLTCVHLEPPLPIAREALHDCQFEISPYEVLDRKVWHNTTLANQGRDERLAKCSFGSPLHGKRKPTMPGDEQDVKARALVRVTISTPKDCYDRNVAHQKLKDVPEQTINRTVEDFLRAGLIKERKVKRQVPGRNYLFAPQFAKHYRSTFELDDFMTAVKLKKDLDTAFTNSDPEKRAYSVSRMAENGTVMALISLASEGKIKLVLKLPPIKNEFNAPLPRISVWGYSEGDYAHRKMDRRRLFWPIEVVPTDAYEYGNPLQPSFSPPAPVEDGLSPRWEPMPEPPLSIDSNGCLPIWSTIDGQKVIHPWWNRILSIVIQAVLFSPGITAEDIYARTETYATEVFEIQLVLNWLVKVKAAKRSPHGTYEALPGYWAVFGNKLIGEDTDEFGEHVRRQKKNVMVGDTWRTEYNREYNLRTQNEADKGQAREEGPSQQIFNNVRRQYTIAKNFATEPVPMECVEHGVEQSGEQNDADPEPEDEGQGQARTTAIETSIPDQVAEHTPLEVSSSTATPAFTPAVSPSNASTKDAEMTDPDADMQDEEDVDAEGESDDEML